MATPRSQLTKGLFLVEEGGTEYHVQEKADGGYVVWTQQSEWKLLKGDDAVRLACIAAVAAL